MLTKEELPECPVATTVQLIGNKWKLLILRNLIYNGAQRFTDFPKTIPGISKKVLTDNLRALESDGLIEREVFAEVPPRVVYSLSELGKTLKPILDAMFDWGTVYINSLSSFGYKKSAQTDFTAKRIFITGIIGVERLRFSLFVPLIQNKRPDA